MAKAQPWRIQITHLTHEAPESLLANPYNVRVHSKKQQEAMAGILDEVGWIEPVIVNDLTGRLINGHMRVGMAISRNEPAVPVLHCELTEEQERLALLTFDQVGVLATIDAQLVDFALQDVTTESAAVMSLLSSIAGQAGLEYGAQAEADQSAEIQPKYQIIVDCESEQAQGELLARLLDEGYECRALLS